jgi:diguanylate cyclase (GGDEF)-like protein
LLIAAAVIGARCVAVPQQRTGWACFGVAVFLNGFGYFVYDLVAWAGRVPSASLADVVWFPVLPLFTTAIWLLARARVGGLRYEVFVGAAAVALLAAAAYSAALGPRVLAWSANGWLDRLVNLYYPSIDMAIVGSVSAVAVLAGGRLGRAWGLITTAVLLTVFGDGWLARLVAEGGTGVERLDPIWSFAGLLIAAAAWQRPKLLTHRPMGIPELSTPLICAALGVLIVLGTQLFGWTPAAAGVATAAVLLSLVRLGLGMRALLYAAEYHRLAITDDLTGLYNRRGFLRGVEEMVISTRPATGTRVILVLGLDRFKDINDGLGHHTGDRVLAAVGHRLSAECRPDDLLARLGGDEFALLTTVSPSSSFEAVVEGLLATVRRPLQVGRITLTIDASVGIAVETDADSGGPVERALEWLRYADTAMYRAKAERIDWAKYDAGRSDLQRDALELAGELRALLTEPAGNSRPDFGWLELHYQPLAAVISEHGARVEALIRWVHPRYGMVMPDRFVALAERIGLVPYLTRQVLTLALDQAATWRAAGAQVTVSVNLSASDLASPTLMTEVLDGLAGRGLPPDALIVEITEQTAIGDLDTGRDALAVLRQAGIGVAIDDFGTGYSALSYLQRLPATELKLDRSLTAKVVDDPAAVAIVRACMGLAHTLGLEVVAEGVETQDHADVLVELGCDWLQGWYYGRPQPAGPEPPLVRYKTKKSVPART